MLFRLVIILVGKSSGLSTLSSVGAKFREVAGGVSGGGAGRNLIAAPSERIRNWKVD